MRNAHPPRGDDTGGTTTNNPMRVSLTKTNSARQFDADIAAAEADADELAKALALGDINWKQELAAKLTLQRLTCDDLMTDRCCAWLTAFALVGFVLGCIADGEIDFDEEQITGLCCGVVLGILKPLFSFRGGTALLYMIPAASSTGMHLMFLNSEYSASDSCGTPAIDCTQLQVQREEVTAVTGVHCNSTGNCVDITTHYAECENGHCLGFGVTMLFALVVEQAAARTHITST